MRIALAHPSYWPEVRRGSERLVHDLGTYLAGRGHEVTLITSHPGPRTVSVEDGVRVVRARRPRRRRPLLRYEDHVESIPPLALELRRQRPDLVHAFHPSYGWAAVRMRRSGAPVVFSYHGVPDPFDMAARRRRLQMLTTTVAGAAATTVLSAAVAHEFERLLGVTPVILPGGVFATDFAVDVSRAADPTIVCAASLGDRRKRAGLLFAAFEELRARRPDARLALVRVPDPHLSGDVPPLPAGAEWVDADRTDELARAYAGAWASVLPSVGEAFGLVLVESLAAGTPAVATRAGAAEEILGSDAVGRLFDGDDPAALAGALDEALELAPIEETVAACREAAAPYDWEAVGAAHERLYESVLSSGAAGAFTWSRTT